MVEQQVMERAVSPDGTPIAFWRSGKGPALLLVHGAIADHSRWQDVLPLFEPRVSVHTMDRRGRGSSGDGSDYTIEAEGDDVAAVVEAIADATGAPVDVLGHSYGAICALEGALRTTGIRRLVLYESGVGVSDSIPTGFTDRVAVLLAAGRRADAVTAVLRDLAGMSADQIELARAAPSWAGRVAAAHTVVRELRAHEAYRFDPTRFAGLTVPTLLLAGSESLDSEAESTALLAAALPGARVITLEGQGHVAMLTAPAMFVSEVLSFLDR